MFIETQLIEKQLAHERHGVVTSRTETDLWTQVVAVEKALDAMRECVNRLERYIAMEARKRIRLFAKRWETNDTESCQFAGDGESLQYL